MDELPKLRRRVTTEQKHDIAHNKVLRRINQSSGDLDTEAQMQQVYDDMGVEIPDGASAVKLS